MNAKSLRQLRNLLENPFNNTNGTCINYAGTPIAIDITTDIYRNFSTNINDYKGDNLIIKGILEQAREIFCMEDDEVITDITCTRIPLCNSQVARRFLVNPDVRQMVEEGTNMFLWCYTNEIRDNLNTTTFNDLFINSNSGILEKVRFLDTTLYVGKGIILYSDFTPILMTCIDIYIIKGDFVQAQQLKNYVYNYTTIVNSTIIPTVLYKPIRDIIESFIKVTENKMTVNYVHPSLISPIINTHQLDENKIYTYGKQEN